MAFRLFELCLTQWRYSMDGPTGLDYQSCRLVAQLEGIRFSWVWRFFRALEHEWLALVRKRQDEAARKREAAAARPAKGSRE